MKKTFKCDKCGEVVEFSFKEDYLPRCNDDVRRMQKILRRDVKREEKRHRCGGTLWERVIKRLTNLLPF